MTIERRRRVAGGGPSRRTTGVVLSHGANWDGRVGCTSDAPLPQTRNILFCSMSNRVVSLTFRHIIDDVIANVRQDFEDMGIEKEVLEELQRSWEAKLVATQVTEFDGAAGRASQLYTVTPTAPLLRPLAATRDGKVEAALPTAAVPGASAEAGTSGSAPNAPIKSEPDEALTHKRKRELDDEGQRADGRDDTAPDAAEKDKDEIGSDLDDSDDDDAEGTEDMILCLYDKVQRVKNKWKCVLRDGVASIGGRDYLFSKCNGYVSQSDTSEFEW